MEKAYGGPVPHLRALVNTTDEIDYDSYLKDAGLWADTETWAIRRVENPNPGQEYFLEHLNLL